MAVSSKGGKSESTDDKCRNGSSIRDNPEGEKEEQGRSGGVGIWWKNLTSWRRLWITGDDDDNTDVLPFLEIPPAMEACEGKKESPAAANKRVVCNPDDDDEERSGVGL